MTERCLPKSITHAQYLALYDAALQCGGMLYFLHDKRTLKALVAKGLVMLDADKAQQGQPFCYYMTHSGYISAIHYATMYRAAILTECRIISAAYFQKEV